MTAQKNSEKKCHLCDRPVQARELCSSHYQRLRRRLKGNNPRTAMDEPFWDMSSQLKPVVTPRFSLAEREAIRRLKRTTGESAYALIRRLVREGLIREKALSAPDDEGEGGELPVLPAASAR